MITYPIADNKQPNRFYYGIGTYVSTDPKDKGIVLSLKDADCMSETRAYVPIDELDKLIANLIKYKKEL
jgi:hypothetical protein